MATTPSLCELFSLGAAGESERAKAYSAKNVGTQNLRLFVRKACVLFVSMSFFVLPAQSTGIFWLHYQFFCW